jgi:hypothetical protein
VSVDFTVTTTHVPTGVDYCTCPTAWWGIYPPPPCPSCQRRSTSGFHGPWPQFVPVQVPTYTPLTPAPLSDDDIKRVADEVVRRLKDGGT